ncbi:MAG: helix-turn-helix domain-containing protein [Planctomycetota bacterium]
MATYLSLEEAAKKLGIPAATLIDLRSQGQVRGFRDGSSWKFPENEIDRLKDELPNISGLGSGILAADAGGSNAGSVIGGDGGADAAGSGSDLELGEEGGSAGGSDVNLIPSDGGTGSDVKVVAGDSGSGLAIDLDDLELAGSAISHDSGELNLASGVGQDASSPTPGPGSQLSLGEDSGELDLMGDAPTPDPASASGDSIDLGAVSGGDSPSSLEMMSDLDLSSDADDLLSSKSSVGGDVLSELDLLAGEAGGSGLITGDSESLLGSSLMSGSSGGSSGVDDALADDDDLIIADDDDDLVVSNMGSDISIAGDSGINLMSPSDSGLSLESEPLDLAGSSISALDLGAEINDGSGTGSGNTPGSGLAPVADTSGSAIDFQADEEFQLSPSGIGLEATEESASQVIEVEESEVAEAVEFDDADGAFADGGFAAEDAFGDEAAAGGLEEMDALDEGGLDDAGIADDGMGIDTSGSVAPMASAGATAYEIPFTLLQTIGLLLIIGTLSLSGMLMTDLVRNMWTYSEPSAPVSSLTDALIGVMGWGS